MIAETLIDLRRGKSAGFISAKFHNTLAEVIVEIARRLRSQR
jgi:hydrogenase maturation factor HypF (carbamoyltransferase family)